jgi:hypothetical protein
MTDLQDLPEPDALRDDVDYLLAMLEPELTEGRGARIAASTPTSTTAGPGGFASTRAYVWHRLSRSEAGKAWDELTTWVDWFVDRYQLDDTLPACWYRHGAIVDELDALRAAWNSAYYAANARPSDPVEWLKNLAQTVTRIRAWDRYGCAAGTHHDDLPAMSDQHAREVRGAHLAEDVHGRSRTAGHEQTTTNSDRQSGNASAPRGETSTNDG